MSDFPRVNLDELKKLKKQNLKERLQFIDRYMEWLKKPRIRYDLAS